jgi:hypothetical protein
VRKQKKEKRSRFDACKLSNLDVDVAGDYNQLVVAGYVAQHGVGCPVRHHCSVFAFGLVIRSND